MAKSDIDIEGIKGRFASARKQALDSGAVDEKALKAQMENDRKIAETRGLILNRTAELEHQLNLFLAYYFTRKEEAAMVFYDRLLTKEFFTFHQKIVLFSDIGYHNGKEFSGRFEGLSGELHKVKDIRNLLAHGHKASSDEPMIRTLTQKAPVRLDTRFMSEFKAAFETSFFSLIELNASIRKTPGSV